MTVIESRRLRRGDRVRCDLRLGTVEFTNWTHIKIKWDETEGSGDLLRHEALAAKLILQRAH